MPGQVDHAVAQPLARPEMRHDRAGKVGRTHRIDAVLAAGDGRVDERQDVRVEGPVELRVFACHVRVVELRADRAVDQRAQLLDAAAHPHDVRELRALERLPREHRRDEQRARAARVFAEIAEEPREQDRPEVRGSPIAVSVMAPSISSDSVSTIRNRRLRVLDIVNAACRVRPCRVHRLPYAHRRA